MKKRTILIVIAAIALLLVPAVIFYQSKSESYITQQKEQIIAADSTAQLWYKNTIIYTLDVEVFKDSDGDGVGDFKGLISKLSYLDSLGVETLWLAPFQPSPNNDDGYDISDFYAVDSRLGSLDDFNDFIDQANDQGFKVIMDLVVNHTSIQHPWFSAARKSKTSEYRPWYVWSAARPDNIETGMVFPGVQNTTWTLDSVSGEYYYHRFYDSQPDLNMQYEPVKKEVKKIIKFWMDRGIDGFRIDAVPFMIEVPQTKGDEFEHQFELLTDMRKYVQQLKKDAILLGEANVLPDENKDYFGERGDGMHMMFNFFVNQHLFYALATGDKGPLSNALKRTAVIPKKSEWGQFLRNHDEVDLGRLSDKERQAVYDAFGPDKDMQLYDRGIRRRLAPMLSGDKKRLELAYSILFSLPSTPVIRYGDEIAMGDDLSLKERMSVRTPMQWDSNKNAGFTTAPKPVLPVIQQGAFTFEAVNISAAQRDTTSLLHWTQKVIALRKQCPEISFGIWKLLETNSDNVLAIQYSWNGKYLITVHNFSNESIAVDVKLDDDEPAAMRDMFTGRNVKAENSAIRLTMNGYQYYWFKSSE